MDNFVPWPAFSLQTQVGLLEPQVFIGNPEIVNSKKSFSQAINDPLYLIHSALESNQLIDSQGLFDYDFYNAPYYREKISTEKIKIILLVEDIVALGLSDFSIHVQGHVKNYRLKNLDSLLDNDNLIKNKLRQLLQQQLLNFLEINLKVKQQILSQLEIILPLFKTQLLTYTNLKNIDPQLLSFLNQSFYNSIAQSLNGSTIPEVAIKPLETSFSIVWNETVFYAIPTPEVAVLYTLNQIR